MENVIDYIDADYVMIKKDSRLSSNQIKTRKESFKSIREKWNAARIRRLAKKVDSLKNELVTDNYKTNQSGYLTNRSVNKLIKKTEAIARLEEKILFLSREGLPKNFVRNRAIKLRNNMMENLRYNSNNAYSVGLDHYDDVFNAANIPNIPLETKEEKNEDIDVKKIVEDNNEKLKEEVNKAMQEENNAAIDLKTIQETVNDEFNKIDNNAIDLKTIQETVNDEFNKLDSNAIDQKEIQKTIDDKFNEVDNENDPAIVPINPELIKEIEEDPLDKIKVSKNESTEAKIDKFNENGEEKVKPMTDEEIAKARENIEYDKYEDVYKWEPEEGLIQNIKTPDIKVEKEEKHEEPIRDLPVIVPERNETAVIIKNEEKKDKKEKAEKQELHMDYSEATEKDVMNAFGRETTVSGLEALKLRALKLQEENKQSKADIDKAKEEQRKEAEKALEYRKQIDAKKAEYNKKYKKLEDYCQKLEEDTRLNQSTAETARNDAATNRKMIEDMLAEMNSYDEEMSEIDSILSPDETNVKTR